MAGGGWWEERFGGVGSLRERDGEDPTWEFPGQITPTSSDGEYSGDNATIGPAKGKQATKMKANDSGYETVKRVVRVDDYDEIYTESSVTGPAVFKKVIVPSIEKLKRKAPSQKAVFTLDVLKKAFEDCERENPGISEQIMHAVFKRYDDVNP
ncbi:5200_t:CDS:2 [Acaulospora colombiana]|uniref:5200_t:CDS:1 n=1 Tax=Acaulospora colombiana TaxID=27376 RepID=A0ACA9KPM9_9GLOM|nr:5200_t:CDS:2 [Acaulospora colombiana]